jgi:hypothetical protein
MQNWLRVTSWIAVMAAACQGGSSSPDGSSSSDTGTSSGPTSSGGGDEGGGCRSIALMPDATGFVAPVTALSPPIVGAWFAYGDGLGQNGEPPGNCDSADAGKHTSAQCSSITFPPAPTDGGTATFPQMTAGTMCLSGTAAQVVGTPLDYSNIYGIGMGLDLSNPSGTPAPYDAKQVGIKALSFTVSGLPNAMVRVELTTPETDPSGDAWSYALTSNGPTTVDLTKLSPSFPMAGEPAFDPSQIEAIQFHVATSPSAAAPVTDFCISQLAVTVCP